jgi:hypothetical protein
MALFFNPLFVSQVAKVLLTMVALLSVRQFAWTGFRQALYSFYPVSVSVSVSVCVGGDTARLWQPVQ